MDAYVQVALMEKVKRTFALDDQSFLSFPVITPVSFQPASLAALLAPSSTADYAIAADFARVVNFIPRDGVAVPDQTSYLWDIYGDVLAHAQPASGVDDPAVEAHQAAAEAVLYEISTDGSRSETQEYVDYRRYRDAWFTAQENYNAQRITAEATSDQAARKQWDDVYEPQLRTVIDQALSDWQTLGHRAEIERALAEVAAAAANNPAARWSEWRASFNPDIDLLTDIGSQYAPTGFSPTDINSDSNWLHTAMDSDEIAKLVSGAPPGLHVEATGDAERIEWEYRAVSIMRPWFNPAVLTSRIWRDGPGQEPLSDGGDPPQGRLPAYVTALILLRHLKVQTKNAEPATPSGPFKFTLDAKFLTKRKLLITPQTMMRVRDPAVVAAASSPSSPRAVAARGFKQLRRHSFVAIERQTPALSRTMIRANAIGDLQRSAAISGHRLPPGASILRREHIDLPRPLGRPGPGGSAHPVAPSTPAPHPADETVSVLAFICNRLPKAPDPLATLSWT